MGCHSSTPSAAEREEAQNEIVCLLKESKRLEETFCVKYARSHYNTFCYKVYLPLKEASELLKEFNNKDQKKFNKITNEVRTVLVDIVRQYADHTCETCQNPTAFDKYNMNLIMNELSSDDSDSDSEK